MFRRAGLKLGLAAFATVMVLSVPSFAAEERIIAAPLGLAIDDMAVAPLILGKAREMGIGVELAL